MYLITLFAVFALAVTVIWAVSSAIAGVWLLTVFSLIAAVCIIAGASLLLRLLAREAFSLLGCVILLAALLIPTVNVLALAVIVYVFVRSGKKAESEAR